MQLMMACLKKMCNGEIIFYKKEKKRWCYYITSGLLDIKFRTEKTLRTFLNKLACFANS